MQHPQAACFLIEKRILRVPANMQVVLPQRPKEAMLIDCQELVWAHQRAVNGLELLAASS